MILKFKVQNSKFKIMRFIFLISMTKPIFNKVTIIGVGLIGASFALAMKKEGSAITLQVTAEEKTTSRKQWK